MKYFPDEIHSSAGGYATKYFGLLTEAFSTIDRVAITRAGALISDAAHRGSFIYSCGNGGSAAIANHLVCDCMKGVRNRSTLQPRVHSLSATSEVLTAVVNDIGMAEMFSFQLTSLGQPGDVLITISSSGASANIVAALKEAKSLGMHTVAMTGFDGGESAKLADINLHVAAQNYGIVEDAHQSLMHILAQYLRHAHLQAPDEIGSLKF